MCEFRVEIRVRIDYYGVDGFLKEPLDVSRIRNISINIYDDSFR